MRNLRSIFFCVLTALAATVVLSSCKKDKDKDDKPAENIVYDGFYVVGDAASIANIQANDVDKARMAKGINEVDKAEREGLYEKYVALEENKAFLVVLKEGPVETNFGATLVSETLTGEEDQPAITILKGDLVSGGAALKVAKSGLYHVVIDLDKDGKIGKPTILVAPVVWGVRGAMNGWGYTELKQGAFDKNTITFSSTAGVNDTVSNAGNFKFSYGGGWKIALNDDVKVETNLGGTIDKLLSGGSDIAIKRGVWGIILTWKLAGGDISNSYSATVDRTGTLPTIPFDKATIFSLIGSAINGDTEWGTDLNFTFVSFADDHAIYEITNATLTPGEFKVRTNNAWPPAFPDYGWDNITITGGGCSKAGGNIATDGGTFKKVTFEFDWDSEVTNAKLTFVE